MPRRMRNHSLFTWLYPGMHIKRWLFLLVIGMTLLSLGAAYLLREAYLAYDFPGVAHYLTLQFIPRWARGVIFVSLALGSVGIAFWKLNQSLLYAVVRPGAQNGSMAQSLYTKRVLSRGPRIVAIGGGTGLSVLLRGLKEYTSNLTAIVTVADDGGSSGRLRQDFGVVAPGDIRQCVAALAEAEPLMSRLFQYRFRSGDGLEGHSFGNLFIVAMANVTGNFETAVHEASRVLNVIGNIFPSTRADVTLSARTQDDELVHGEHNITEHGARIRDLFLNPPDAEAHPDAVRAILDADVVVIGPGSLYTSVMPNLLVEDLRKALLSTGAQRLFVCNVATENGETDDFGVADHIEAIERHTAPGLIEAVIANDNLGALPEELHSTPVSLEHPDARVFEHVRVVQADVVAGEDRYRHDFQKLAAAILDVYHGRENGALEAERTPSEETALAAR
ncbi:MAG: YvcK family protein [Chloroflexi bacterium]|nr:YvcK family protein [Chloroflexota bacterium]